MEVACDDNLLPHLRSEVIDGILQLGFEDDGQLQGQRDSYLPDPVCGIELDRNQWSHSNRGGYALSTGDMSFQLSGSSTMEWNRVEAANVILRGSGSSKVRVAHWDSDALDMSNLAGQAAWRWTRANPRICRPTFPGRAR